MVLVNTSVWIDHFRKTNDVLVSLLNKGNVVTHEFIIGELACGKFNNDKQIMNLLNNLQKVKKITLEEYLLFIEKYQISGKGIGFVDVHLLASSKLSGYPLFTHDKKLLNVAKKLKLSFL